MRYLVSKHTGHFVTRQFFDRERGDHQQTSTACKGVQIVGWQNRQCEAPVRDRQLLGHTAPRRFESLRLFGRGSSSAQHAPHQDLLQRSPKHHDHGTKMQSGKGPKPNVPPDTHGQPEHHERDQPHRDDGDQRQYRSERRQLNRTLGAARTTHAISFVRRWGRVLNGSQSRSFVASPRPIRFSRAKLSRNATAQRGSLPPKASCRGPLSRLT